MSSTNLSGNTIQQKNMYKLKFPYFTVSPSSTSDQLQPTATEKKETIFTWSALHRYGMPMDIIWHYHYMLSMNGAQVGILQEICHVIFSGLLQCLDGAHLEVQVICPLFPHYLMHQVHKRPLADEELSAYLILAYLMESHCPWLVPLGPLQPTL